MTRPFITLTVVTLAGAGTVIAAPQTSETEPQTFDATELEPEPRVDSRGLGDVFFEFDSARVPEDPSIQDIVEFAEANPDATIVLDGHADAVGAADYNVGLSSRRAENVRSELVESGVDPERILLGIYGEDAPRRPAHALDRRVTAWATEDPLHAIVDHTLGDGVALVWDEPVTAAEIEGQPAEAVATR